MINSVSASAYVPQTTSSSLSEEQYSLIEKTLSEFDAANLSQQDAISIVEVFSEAGIRPGRELESAMAELGFDAETVGDLAGLGPSREGSKRINPMEANQFNEMVDTLSQLIDTALQESETGQISDEQKLSIYDQMAERFDVKPGSSIIHKTV